MIELTTRFAGISTSPASRGVLMPAQAVSRAKANLRYICRPRALAAEVAVGLKDGEGVPLPPAAARAELRRRIERRAGQGGRRGIRVAERMILTLPNEWGRERGVEALTRVLARLLPLDSEAAAIGVIHAEPGNLHAHVLAVDGRESPSAAQARRPGGKRIRRADVLRLGERGRPRALRALIAAELNAYAAQEGLEGVEWRSFEERDLGRSPGHHEGPGRRAVRQRAEFEAMVEVGASGGFEAIGDLFPGPTPQPQGNLGEAVSVRPHQRPRRDRSRDKER